MLRNGSLVQMADFDLGALRIRPGRRLVEGPAGSVPVEPLVMQLLVELTRRAGCVVPRREIFEHCWGSAAVGDDSLNRVVAALRKALQEAGNGVAAIETVPSTGYLLRLHTGVQNKFDGGTDPTDVQRAIDDGYNSIRLSLPEPDHLRLEQLRRAVALEPGNPGAWGMLALLCRYAAEYAEPHASSAYVSECEASARRSLALEPLENNARVALATISPLFGRWHDAHTRLCEIACDSSSSFFALHEQAIVEMATGRVQAAKALVDGLLAKDSLAACLCYKSIYQHWSTGDLAGMDHVADRAIQLWPTHPAVWTARFWTLAHTGRAHAAAGMLDDTVVRAPIPPPAASLLRAVVNAVVSGDPAAIDRAAGASGEAARSGPACAIIALFGLGLLGRTDEQFDVAYSYYFREGHSPVPVRRTDGEPSVNDQHRRVTQILFTPACAALRRDPRFFTLCDRTGLSAYWEKAGLQPDFLNPPPAE